ncbi:DEAD/DEAH box helicase family protein [Acidithiobacillus caldus]|uniref:DEAD/DEAH box helicase family protein n=1 Tax=Acidithiobacillus caldus TaxID=33059 RepID=UPI001C07C4E3|nr:DEAD/DEAH box helicase family protein [Acidithiobacillus caldus]MBU2771600.1 DEAD/DEAH box helicase family protein [Acidithiobacillus caldus]
MNDTTVVNTNQTTIITTSVRQDAAHRRWENAAPATPEQVAQILSCSPELADIVARFARLDSKTRQGQQNLLMPFQTKIGGQTRVSAIQFQTKNQMFLDTMGAREISLGRNQEAATFTLKGMENSAGGAKKTAFIVSSHLDAAAIHHTIPGADVIVSASPNLPQRRIHRLMHDGKTQIFICSWNPAEMGEIVLRCQDAGWTGSIRGFAAEEVATEIDADGKPLDQKTVRTNAWNILQTQGPDALKNYLREMNLLVGKKAAVKERKLENKNRRRRNILEMPQKTEETRADRDDWLPDVETARRAIDKAMDDALSFHVAGEENMTGLGKTYAALALMLRDKNHPYILVAPTIELAEEIYHKINGMNDGSRTVAMHVPRSEANCQRYHTVQFIQDKNRAPFAHACMMSDLEKSIPGNCPHADECKQSGYLGMLRETAHADIVIATHAAAQSDSTLLKQISGPDESATPRRIVVDEETPPVTMVKAKLDDVRQLITVLTYWLGNHKWIRDRVRGQLDDPTAEKLDKETERTIEAYEKQAEALTAIAAELAQWIDPRKSETPIQIHATDVWGDFIHAYKAIPDYLTQMDGSTLPERPIMSGPSEKWIIPRQFLGALCQGLKDGIVWIFHGELVIGKEGGLWKNLMSQGGMQLDATMGMMTKMMIESYHNPRKKNHKGHVTTIACHQPHHHLYQIIDGRQHGKASLSAQGLPSEMRSFLTKLAKLISEYGHGSVAVMTHKFIHDMCLAIFSGDHDALDKIRVRMKDSDIENTLKLMGDMRLDDPAGNREKWGLDESDIEQIGHWGKDDRGHNRWEKHQALMIWGAPVKPPEEYLIEYAACRVIAARHGVELPAWDGSVARFQKIRTNGGERIVLTSFPLPTVPEAAAFVLDQVNAQIAQAVGRLRGVNRTAENPANIYLHVGDFPVAAEGHDHMLPGVQYFTDLASAAAIRSAKQTAIVNEIALTPEEQMCVGAIRDALNAKFGFTCRDGDKAPIGERTVRTNIGAIRDYARKHRISLKAAAADITQKTANLLPGPADLYDWALYLNQRLQAPQKWCRAFLGADPWVAAAISLMEEIRAWTAPPTPA